MAANNKDIKEVDDKIAEDKERVKEGEDKKDGEKEEPKKDLPYVHMHACRCIISRL